jgi:hypothetical protein
MKISLLIFLEMKLVYHNHRGTLLPPFSYGPKLAQEKKSLITKNQIVRAARRNIHRYGRRDENRPVSSFVLGILSLFRV